MAEPPYTPDNPATVAINGVEIPNRLTYLTEWASNLERAVERLSTPGFDMPASIAKYSQEAKALRDTIQLLEALGIERPTDAPSS